MARTSYNELVHREFVRLGVPDWSIIHDTDRSHRKGRYGLRALVIGNDVAAEFVDDVLPVLYRLRALPDSATQEQVYKAVYL